MALSQAELEQKIAALEGALARGELRVEFADRSVTYRQTNELREALAYFRDQLAGVLGTRRSRRALGVMTGSGF